MKLTFRQKAFLNKLLDSYRERQQPVHYSVLAKQLGLNNSTAYDMLRLLEKKGMAIAKYGTPKNNSGPGRSTVRFIPTAEAIELIANLGGDVKGQDKWEDVKARIIKNLSRGKTDGFQDLMDELLDKIPEPRSPLIRCAEVITTLMLNFKEAKQELIKQKTIDNLLKAPASKLRMSVLAGLILGLSHATQGTHKLFNKYQESAEKYEASLQELNRDNLLKLHEFTCNVWDILKNPA